MTKKIMIIAGEFSGDRLGGGLMESLKKQSSEPIEFVGLGGPKMAEQGLQSAFNIEETNVMGLVEVLPKIPNILKRIKEMVLLAEAEKVDALITIDAPDFSLRVAKKIKKSLNIPCVHYVSPQVWAWRQGRVKKMAKFLDHVLALFPFEEQIYKKYGLPCTFVGHPLMEELEPFAPENRDGASYQKKKVQTLAILPGSRPSVMSRLFPVMMDAAGMLRQRGKKFNIVVPVARSEHKDFLLTLHPLAKEINFVEEDDRFEPLCKASAALAASGTSNLELAAIGLPMAICYRMHELSYKILNYLVRVPYISPVNWVAGNMVVPEFVQDECTAERVAIALDPLLDKDTPIHHAQEISLKNVRDKLRGVSEPSTEAAKVVLSYLG